jgi:hypothetical protein
MTLLPSLSPAAGAIRFPGALCDQIDIDALTVANRNSRGLRRLSISRFHWNELAKATRFSNIVAIVFEDVAE